MLLKEIKNDTNGKTYSWILQSYSHQNRVVMAQKKKKKKKTQINGIGQKSQK